MERSRGRACTRSPSGTPLGRRARRGTAGGRRPRGAAGRLRRHVDRRRARSRVPLTRHRRSARRRRGLRAPGAAPAGSARPPRVGGTSRASPPSSAGRARTGCGPSRAALDRLVAAPPRPAQRAAPSLGRDVAAAAPAATPTAPRVCVQSALETFATEIAHRARRPLQRRRPPARPAGRTGMSRALRVDPIACDRARPVRRAASRADRARRLGLPDHRRRARSRPSCSGSPSARRPPARRSQCGSFSAHPGSRSRNGRGGRGRAGAAAVGLDQRAGERKAEAGRAGGGDVRGRRSRRSSGAGRPPSSSTASTLRPSTLVGRQPRASAAVGERVLEQHVERLGDAARADAGGQRRVDVDRAAAGRLARRRRARRRRGGGRGRRGRGRAGWPMSPARASASRSLTVRSRRSATRRVASISSCAAAGILERGQLVEAQDHGGQRRAQLVGDVGRELALAADELRDLRRRRRRARRATRSSSGRSSGRCGRRSRRRRGASDVPRAARSGRTNRRACSTASPTAAAVPTTARPPTSSHTWRRRRVTSAAEA